MGATWLYEYKQIPKQERQIVARYARLTPSCKAGACTGQNSSMKNNKLSKQELWFLRTALPIDEIYPPMKFHNPS